jgi:hypothetical protein
MGFGQLIHKLQRALAADAFDNSLVVKLVYQCDLCTTIMVLYIPLCSFRQASKSSVKRRDGKLKRAKLAQVSTSSLADIFALN